MSKKEYSVSAADTSAGLTYKDAGVDIDAGSELVRRIAKMAPGIGGFGGLYPLGMVSYGILLFFNETYGSCYFLHKGLIFAIFHRILLNR